MGLPFCSRCGAKLGERSKSKYCPACRKNEKSYGLYRQAFRAKRTVYILQSAG